MPDEHDIEFYKRRCEYYKYKAKVATTELEEVKREWERFRLKWARRKKNYRDMQRALEAERMKHNLLKLQTGTSISTVIKDGSKKTQAELDALSNKLAKVHNFAKGF